MNLLHLSQGYWPAIGGTELLIQRVSEELAHNYNDKVTVFTTNCYNAEAFNQPALPRMKTGWEELNGVKIKRFPVEAKISRTFSFIQKTAYHLNLPYNDWLRTIYNGPIIKNLQKEIIRDQSELVACSSFPLLHMFDAISAAKKSQKKIVLHGGIHPFDNWGFDRKNIYKSISQADAYLANTEYEKMFLQKKGIPKELIHVVGVGMDPQTFDIEYENAREEMNWDSSPVVGFIGQIGGHKGVDTLIRAMPLVWEDFPDVKILIAGGKTSFSEKLDHYIAKYWKPSDKEKLTLIINFPNNMKATLFSAIDIFAYPSGFESFGISYLEAWCTKKPVIGCKSGAVPWVITQGEDGLLTDYQNEKMLAAAIKILLSSKDYQQQLGQNGYEKAIANFTWKQVSNRFRMVYEKVMLS